MTVVEETRTPNAEQLAAIDAPGLVFVSAGAGTGKTTVLVERFVKPESYGEGLEGLRYRIAL